MAQTFLYSHIMFEFVRRDVVCVKNQIPIYILPFIINALQAKYFIWDRIMIQLDHI